MYETVLIPTDGSDGTALAADHALDIASKYGADVVALSVVDTRNRFGGESVASDAAATAGMEAARRTAEHAVQAVADRASERIAVETVVASGVPYETILDAVDARGVDLVVMGTHGRTGVRRQLLGSVTERVLRHASVPVLAVDLDGGDG